ncbi:MAG TPA: hypothetical protein VEC99_07380 [Clostridia bacterium]|nr:hypothetical protein [Clostridia bacterium]
MVGAVIILFALLALSGVFLSVAGFMAFHLTPDGRRKQMLRWLAVWSAKGLVLPLALWMLMNVGLSWSLQPFMPEVQAAQNSGGSWMPEFLQVTGQGLFVLSSYWTALTLGWLLVSAGLGTDDESRKDFRSLCLTCFLALIIPGAILVLLGGWAMVGVAATMILAPMAGYGRGYLQPAKTPPMYAKAIARIKFGKYSEAEWEIIRELEKSHDDFEGWMMLADLYATHFNDLLEAERTIMEICDQPKLTPTQLSLALHKLADWHLKLAQDPDAARRALQVICDRLRGSHLAHMAQLRINQLPRTVQELRDQQNAPPIPLPALSKHLEETSDSPETEMDQKQAAQMANACAEQLKKDPNYIPAREKLARLLAQHLEKPDLGIEQLMLLLNLPEQPENKRAEWLALIAAWHLKYRHDPQTGRNCLERLINEFPETPQAFAARHKLESLNREPRQPTEQAQPTQTGLS